MYTCGQSCHVTGHAQLTHHHVIEGAGGELQPDPAPRTHSLGGGTGFRWDPVNTCWHRLDSAFWDRDTYRKNPLMSSQSVQVIYSSLALFMTNINVFFVKRKQKNVNALYIKGASYRDWLIDWLAVSLCCVGIIGHSHGIYTVCKSIESICVNRHL